MSGLALPCTLTLPSGTRITLARRAPAEAARASSQRRERGHEDDGPRPRFADVLAVLAEDVTVAPATKDAPPIVIDELPLADFHVLRAFLTKAGLVDEDDVELECHNCAELLVARPCSELEVGPWLDGELDDPELDRTLEPGVPVDVGPVPIGRVRQARTVTFGPLRVRDAKTLFAAVARDPIVVDERLVASMGIRALGAVTDAAEIARALSECDDEAFASVTDAFLDTHYSLRLASDVICTKCKAKSTTLAPAVREFELGPGGDPPEPSETDHVEDADGGAPEAPAAATRLPPLEEFVELAHAIADPLIAEIPGEKAVLVVEDGTPAVDDGGVPLLGSYVPPPPRDLPVPTRPPTVTIYYRTFAAIEREEGPFDWRGELSETIAHELEHHVFFLRGDDPMDEEEHAEIDREALRIIGQSEAQRRALVGFGQSIPEFFQRAWPLVLLGALMLALTLAEARCAP